MGSIQQRANKARSLHVGRTTIAADPSIRKFACPQKPEARQIRDVFIISFSILYKISGRADDSVPKISTGAIFRYGLIYVPMLFSWFYDCRV